ncbi:MAG: glycosyltransferase family 2 protein [Terracidiphilus sp.]
MKPSIVILTFNSVDSVSETLTRAQAISDDIHIVDSGSTDGTLELVEKSQAHVHHRNFISYSDQRNWAITTLPLRYSWQLHLDADESMSATLQQEIRSLPENPEVEGFFIKRYLRFLGRVLRHNLAPTWHMRLFQTGRGRCETREYDQHFYCQGATSQLKGEMIDDITMSLSEWTARHNRWSDAEVRELLSKGNSERIKGNISGNIVERKRFYRGIYDRSPLLFRAIALFFYRYIVKGGFLDGKEGFIFCILQCLWFRFLVDAKLVEKSREQTTKRP